MKNKTNYLLILTIVCLFITSLFCFGSYVFESPDSFPATNEVLEKLNNADPNDPGLGWYILIAGGTSLFADFATKFILMFLIVFMPIIICLLNVLFQTIARLFQIGVDKKWKNILSIIFSVISLIMQILLIITLFVNLTNNIGANKILLIITLILNLVIIGLFIRKLFCKLEDIEEKNK